MRQSKSCSLLANMSQLNAVTISKVMVDRIWEITAKVMCCSLFIRPQLKWRAISAQLNRLIIVWTYVLMFIETAERDHFWSDPAHPQLWTMLRESGQCRLFFIFQLTLILILINHLLSQVAMSRFDTKNYLPYDKLQSNLKIVKKRFVPLFNRSSLTKDLCQ